MIVYIIVYAISLYFTYKACDGKLWLNHILAIAFPVLLLTFRDESVGTDTGHYIDIFNFCESADSLMFVFISSRTEIGFATITYAISHLGMDINVAFLIYALLSIIPVYIGALCMKDKASPVLIMALYYLMFYHYSFNIVRQSIAMSFVFLSVVQMLKGNVKLSIVLWILAVLNHNSAIIGVVFLSFIILRNRSLLLKAAVLISLFLAVIILANTLFVEQLDYYEGYFDKGQGRAEKSYILEMFINYLIVLYARIKLMEDSSLFFLASLTTLMLIIISPVAPFFFRLANISDVLMLIYIPQILCSIAKPIHKYHYLFFAAFYWWFVFIYNNSGDSYPYIINL